MLDKVSEFENCMWNFMRSLFAGVSDSTSGPKEIEFRPLSRGTAALQDRNPCA
jgi:hypothetical protein